MIETYSEENLPDLYKKVAKKDKELSFILKQYGYPPLWVRPNTFETLVLTILEQQVSLASAYAAYKKLKERIKVTPQNLLHLTDEELKSCYLSRQKITYTRVLATAIVTKKINLKNFEKEDNDAVRKSLKQLKGIGDWTVDVYLIHVLRRRDVFPIGDLALVNAIKMLKGSSLNKDEIMVLAEQWKPYRTIATLLFWHYYIKKKNIILLH